MRPPCYGMRCTGAASSLPSHPRVFPRTGAPFELGAAHFVEVEALQIGPVVRRRAMVLLLLILLLLDIVEILAVAPSVAGSD